MQTTYIPYIIHIDFTGKYNFTCIHCRGTYSENDISLDDWIKIIDKIFKIWNDKILWIEIGGREPTIRKKELVELIKYIKYNYSFTNILLVTNGY